MSDADLGIKPKETAKYIGGIARELRVLAARSDLTFLSYLLSMVEEEASTAARATDVAAAGDSKGGRRSAG